MPEPIAPSDRADGRTAPEGLPDLEALRVRLGPRLLTDPDQVAPYCRDASRAVPDGPAHAVVLAADTADVSAALAWANEHRVPVSVRGGGTGLSGGAVSYPSGLVVSLEAMNRIIDIDMGNRLADVQAGVITADLDAAARERGLFFPPDPASSRTSTVAGNIASNAGGLRGVAHGVLGDFVAALEVVLADGRVLRTGRRTTKDATGYDLTSLFVGSEGTWA
ncbi:FAD-binding oxidoreductase [Sanguibacter sp. Z1732]|uniref:FAD-binding oxidoreductase n=1 Tax=Sanguibacter sp. Z1732 TaxID=3435412 RepID=UPI003D9CA785